ncbi:hypothetical protein PRZ48_009298 [Zasmidium cellare]|uniref:BTB domain-containing protein n=1 Tax=Zasmidium cellare TaxID=395010 RepID=A0ABR0ECJ6_ZASCE|nr:hypothetical protein PRZ48_009298 [Zasmidium cellare]
MELPRTLVEEFRKLRYDHSISDFTIESDTGKQWKVHKLVLRLHSDVLYRMSTSPEFLECQRSRVILHGIQDRHIEAMVNFFYNLPHKLSEEGDCTTSVDDWTDEGLKDYFTSNRDLLQLADMYNVKELLKALVQDLEFFFNFGGTVELTVRAASAMVKVEDVPDEMWGPLTDHLAYHFARDVPEESELEKLQDVLASCPQVAIGALKRIAEKNRGNRYESWSHMG